MVRTVLFKNQVSIEGEIHFHQHSTKTVTESLPLKVCHTKPPKHTAKYNQNWLLWAYEIKIIFPRFCCSNNPEPGFWDTKNDTTHLWDFFNQLSCQKQLVQRTITIILSGTWGNRMLANRLCKTGEIETSFAKISTQCSEMKACDKIFSLDLK